MEHLRSLRLWEVDVSTRLAERLGQLRKGRNLSLEELAKLSGVSRATLSRLEHGEVSPTAAVLGRLCAAYGMTMSRLMAEVEGEGAALVRMDDQTLWVDPETGFRRQSISPPAAGLVGEMILAELPKGAEIAYATAPRPGLEHHLYLLEGGLEMTIDATAYELKPGDCLRYRLYGASKFRSTGRGPAHYILAILG
jgi:transcriptional regulator with XRE-family HTH domain